MSTRNQNFYNLNSVRAYPLDDRATRTGDGGERLPNDVLADLNLRFPKHLGQYAYLSSLAVSGTLVTATFLACPSPDSAADFVPLAAVTVRKPVQANRHYALDALHPGVGGWVVFGDTGEAFAARFSTPRQGLLLPRCARPYHALPVETARKLGVATGLTGLVRLRGTGDVEVVSAERRVDGVNRKVVLVRLRSFSAGRNVFDIYKGPCGKRPESENCDREGVQFLNTVGPDCDGNVDIVFAGDTEVTPYAGGSEGLVVDHPLGLTEACTKDDRLPDRRGRLPNEYDDDCTSEFEGQYAEDTNTDGEEPPPVADVPYVSSEVMGCPELPYQETFDDADAEDWRVIVGTFGFAADDSPDQPRPPAAMVSYLKGYTVHRFQPYVYAGSSVSSSEVGTLSSSSAVSSAPLPDGWSYAAVETSRRNVSLWDTCAHATTRDKRVRADLKVVDGGPRANAGIVLNYHTIGVDTQFDQYMVAEVDHPSDSVRLRLWTGMSFSTIGVVSGLGLVLGDWYRVEAEVIPHPVDPTITRIHVTLAGITNPAITAGFTTDTSRYMPDNGRFGLATDQSGALFSYFFLEEI